MEKKQIPETIVMDNLEDKGQHPIFVMGTNDKLVNLTETIQIRVQEEQTEAVITYRLVAIFLNGTFATLWKGTKEECLQHMKKIASHLIVINLNMSTSVN